MDVTAVARSDRSSRLLGVAFRPVWVALGAVALLHVVGVGVPPVVRYGVLLTTLVVFGLPHGAVDHLSVPRALEAARTRRLFAVVGLLYLVVGGAYAVLWFFAPAAAFAVFIALTWFHWGQGDLYPLRALAADYPADRVGSALTVLVRGGLPMLVPLLFFPERYRTVAVTLVGLFDPSRAALLAPAFNPDVRLAVGAGFGALTLAALGWGYWTDGGPAWRLDAVETGLLWAYFAVVPPVLAIGLYFPVWHSLRHIVRVVDLDRSPAETRRSTVWRLRRFAREAAPATGGALLLFGLLALAVPHTPASLADLAGVYLVLLAVLTLPHVVVVTWLDRVQGTWSQGRDRPDGRASAGGSRTD